MEATVRELLAANFFNDSKVLAGGKGLNNKIKAVNFLETQYSYQYYAEGTFAITSAYYLLNSNTDLDMLMDNLSEAKVTALGIDLEPHQQLPDVINRKADEYNLPVISIKYLYVDILDFIMNHIYLSQKSEFIRKQKASNILHGSANKGSIEGLAKTLFGWTGRQVALVHRQKKIEHMNTWLPDIPYAEQINFTMNEVHSYGDPGDDDAIVHYSHTLDGRTLEWIGTNLKQNNRRIGQICFEQGERAFDKNDYQLLQIAKKVYEIEIKGILSISEEKRNNEDNFVRNILEGRIKDYDEVVSEGKTFGWDLTEEVTAICASPSSDGSGSFGNDEVDGLSDYFLRNYGRKVITAMHDSYLVILLPVKLGAPRDIAEKIRKFLHKDSDLPFAIGISNLASCRMIEKSYSDAISAIQVGTKLLKDIKTEIFIFKELGIYRFFACKDVSREMIDFYEDLLMPIIDYDKENNADLFNTLCIYYAAECNPNIASEQMFLHGNTVRYRLGLIEKLCGICLKLEEDRFNMHLALKIGPLINEVDRNGND
jgi:purine catabolism regulator